MVIGNMVLNRLTVILALFTGFCLYGQNQFGNDIIGINISDYLGFMVSLSSNENFKIIDP